MDLENIKREYLERKKAAELLSVPHRRCYTAIELDKQNSKEINKCEYLERKKATALTKVPYRLCYTAFELKKPSNNKDFIKDKSGVETNTLSDKIVSNRAIYGCSDSDSDTDSEIKLNEPTKDVETQQNIVSEQELTSNEESLTSSAQYPINKSSGTEYMTISRNNLNRVSVYTKTSGFRMENLHEGQVSFQSIVSNKATISDCTCNIPDHSHTFIHERHCSEKMTYCRPVLKMYNQEYLYKSAEKNNRLRCLVKKIVEVRDKEKQSEAWNNYINCLKNKHGYNNKDSLVIPIQNNVTEGVNSELIDHYYTTTFASHQSNPCRSLSQDVTQDGTQDAMSSNFYRMTRTSQPEVSRWHIPYYRPFPHENDRYCYPISSQGRLLVIKREGEKPGYYSDWCCNHGKRRQPMIITRNVGVASHKKNPWMISTGSNSVESTTLVPRITLTEPSLSKYNVEAHKNDSSKISVGRSVQTENRKLSLIDNKHNDVKTKSAIISNKMTSINSKESIGYKPTSTRQDSLESIENKLNIILSKINSLVQEIQSSKNVPGNLSSPPNEENKRSTDGNYIPRFTLPCPSKCKNRNDCINTVELKPSSDELFTIKMKAFDEGHKPHSLRGYLSSKFEKRDVGIGDESLIQLSNETTATETKNTGSFYATPRSSLDSLPTVHATKTNKNVKRPYEKPEASKENPVAISKTKHTAINSSRSVCSKGCNTICKSIASTDFEKPMLIQSKSEIDNSNSPSLIHDSYCRSYDKDSQMSQTKISEDIKYDICNTINASTHTDGLRPSTCNRNTCKYFSTSNTNPKTSKNESDDNMGNHNSHFAAHCTSTAYSPFNRTTTGSLRNNIIKKDRVACAIMTDSNVMVPYYPYNLLRLNRVDCGETKIDEILIEELDKSNQAKRDIEEILNRQINHPCIVKVTIDLPTSDRSTDATESETKSGEESMEEVITPMNNIGNERKMTIAVNTDPLSLLALLRISSETIRQFLSYMPFNYNSYLSKLQFPQSSRTAEITTSSRSHYVCNLCGEVFEKPSQLSDHIREHNLCDVRDCCVCRHLLDIRQPSPSVFRCRHCGKCYTRAYCCELHQQSCRRRLGVSRRDVNESLMILS